MNLKKAGQDFRGWKIRRIARCLHSVVEALKHSGYANDAEVKINWVNANDVTAENVAELLEMRMGSSSQVVLVNGNRRKNSAIKYAREQDVPMLGVCLGMQLTCIEFARHV